MGSKTSVTNTSDNHSNNANIQGGLSATQGDGNAVTINQLDGGAVSGAIALATHAVDSGAGTLGMLADKFSQWTTISSNATAQMLNAIQADSQANTKQVADAYRTSTGAVDGQKLVVGLVVGVVIITGIVIYAAGGKHGK